MKGWRGSPARHALAAKGIGVVIVERPAAVPIARPQRAVTVGDVFDVVTSRAFSEAASSGQAEALLANRDWLKSAIHSECQDLQLTVTESCQLENELLPMFDQEEALLPGLIQVVDQLRPREVAP